jgi:phosphatidylethanolamine/phosphatidyl-N-methylethanolamine N-methyltransferase
MSAQFFLSLIMHPATMGCLAPSSKYLAHAMARAADRADLVVELGAGTGSVTKALLETHPDVPLIAVELQPNLAGKLQQKFPKADVRHDTAKSVIDGLDAAPLNTVLVSSLPFRSLPPLATQETVASICAFLHGSPTRKLIQFTYQPREPFTAPPGFVWTRTSFVWRNAPPAGVWELRAVSLN